MCDIYIYIHIYMLHKDVYREACLLKKHIRDGIVV